MEVWILWVFIVLPFGQQLIYEGTQEFSSSDKCEHFGQPMANILVTNFPGIDIVLTCQLREQQKV